MATNRYAPHGSCAICLASAHRDGLRVYPEGPDNAHSEADDPQNSLPATILPRLFGFRHRLRRVLANNALKHRTLDSIVGGCCRLPQSNRVRSCTNLSSSRFSMSPATRRYPHALGHRWPGVKAFQENAARHILYLLVPVHATARQRDELWESGATLCI
jgi:hypothetical protein